MGTVVAGAVVRYMVFFRIYLTKVKLIYYIHVC